MEASSELEMRDDANQLETIPYNCDILATEKYYPQDDEKDNRALLIKRPRDHVSVLLSITVGVLYYLLNGFMHIGWRGVQIICATKLIRINHRALLNVLFTVLLKNNIKAIGWSTMKVKGKIYPMIKMSKTSDNLAVSQEVVEKQPINTDKRIELMKAVEDSISVQILAQPASDKPILADVIFVHGIHGSVDETWKQGEWSHGNKSKNFIQVSQATKSEVFDTNNNDSESTVINAKTYTFTIDQEQTSSRNIETIARETISQCWPQDWLPMDCPNTRIIALNYDTDPYLWRPIWLKKQKRSNLERRARKMIKLLLDVKVGEKRPIIWVGHSKGGLYIKQILVNAYESQLKETAALWSSSRGVLFYSVPHRGSPLADLNLPLLKQSIEMIEIRNHFPSIIDLHRRFVALCESGHLKLQVFSFIETALTELSIFYLRIVGYDSADPGIGDVQKMQLDHLDICKPRNRKCTLYTRLTEMINKITHLENYN